MKLKTLQMATCMNDYDRHILKMGGIKRIHGGWYSVTFRGVKLDASTVISAKRNKGGKICRFT